MRSQCSHLKFLKIKQGWLKEEQFSIPNHSIKQIDTTYHSFSRLFLLDIFMLCFWTMKGKNKWLYPPLKISGNIFKFTPPSINFLEVSKQFLSKNLLYINFKVHSKHKTKTSHVILSTDFKHSLSKFLKHLAWQIFDFQNSNTFF